MKQVKHGGCNKCGSKDQEILKSVMVKGEPMGKALCDECIKKNNVDVKNWK